MATQFSFPPSPTVGQIASLPDGNQAQWNGYAWVEVGGSGITTYFTDTAPPNPKFGDRWIRPASATEVVWVPNANNAGVWLDLVDAGAPVYPIAISHGGTGATDLPTARLNLGITNAAGQMVITPDGTVAAPGLAFGSEPGLGWYRSAAGSRRFAVGGLATEILDSSAATSTGFILLPRVQGISNFFLRNQPVGSTNLNQLALQQNADGSASLATSAAGTATRGNLTLDAPQVLFNDGTVAAPNIAFASEPGLGLYRRNPGELTFAAGGGITATLQGAAAASSLFVAPRAAGIAGYVLRNQPIGTANYNQLGLFQNADGSAMVQTVAAGTATRGNLTLDAPGVTVTANNITLITSAGDSAFVMRKPASGNSNHIYGYKATSLRWGIELGGAEAETGADVGSDFSISRFNDAGTWLSNPFNINRKTGNVTAQGLTREVDHLELRAKLDAALARLAALEAV